MAEEEVELPVELNKLEITPILPQVKILDNNLPVHLNPFFENDIKDTDEPGKNQQPSTDNTNLVNQPQLIYPRPASKCRRCPYRRASESVLDDIKCDTSATNFPECSRTPPSRILKQPLKNTAISSMGGLGNRRVLLRDPILKVCRSPGKNNLQLTTKGLSDFRKLIDECRNLLSDEVEFTDKLNKLCLGNRNSRNFTTMQTPKICTVNSNKLRSNRKQITNTTSHTESSLSAIPMQEHQHHNQPNGMPLIQPSLLGNRISTTTILQQRNTNNLSPEHPRSSTTCSQQAGNSATAASPSDDVTIDELASYFDTFVHIPKKMSSMAEMMYI